MRLLALAVPPVMITGLLAGPAAAEPWPTHHVSVPGAYNVRDIGGYKASGGKKVRYGLVYRSAHLTKVTPEGVEALKKLGIGVNIDFRTKSEVGKDGAGKLPPGVKTVRAPISFGQLKDIFTIISLHPAVKYMEGGYRKMVANPSARKEFAKAFRTVANSKRPVLYNCTAGKDRTGVMTAILLTAVGVPKSTVYADYLMSNKQLEAPNKEIIDYLEKESVDSRIIYPALWVRSSFLDAWFAEIKKRYGSFDRFLTKGLGIKAKEKAKLRKKLLK